ncbi:hypothetical protein A5893_10100 [Pedobacter psychrophilus]|uniref:Uncharacterized protein n=1 Tax=Pedobacter psychrophilus TaxID=1826909 RepID=A0A179DFS8_9SPHI|nr:hypothetical protein A5893_10100 [Pedobacter psychrophilus]
MVVYTLFPLYLFFEKEKKACPTTAGDVVSIVIAAYLKEKLKLIIKSTQINNPYLTIENIVWDMQSLMLNLCINLKSCQKN